MEEAIRYIDARILYLIGKQTEDTPARMELIAVKMKLAELEDKND